MWRTTGWRRAMEEAAGKSDEDPKVKRLYARAEEILAEAVKPEKLKGNPYKGKPLRLEPDGPYDKELAMANRMLKSAGFKPPWVESREEILEEKRALRQMMERRLRRIERAAREGAAGGERLAALEAEHGPFLELLRERIEKLRRRILKFNLEVPLVDQQVVNVSFDSFTQEFREAAARYFAGRA